MAEAQTSTTSTFYFHVECEQCGFIRCEDENDDSENFQKAVDLWNTRADEALITQARDALADMLSDMHHESVARETLTALNKRLE